MNPFFEWANKHRISNEALLDLYANVLGFQIPDFRTVDNSSEAATQQRVRIKASAQGRRMWRNNCGVAFREDGVPIRFGLANDSAAVHAKLRSSDLIGITPVIITPAHVGFKFGLFTSWEIKRPDWRYDPNDEHSRCQHAWNNLVVSLGGDGRFITSENQI